MNIPSVYEMEQNCICKLWSNAQASHYHTKKLAHHLSEDRHFKQISTLTLAQSTVQVVTASPKKPFSCCESTASFLILKQPLCWWFGNDQTPALPSIPRSRCQRTSKKLRVFPVLHYMYPGHPWGITWNSATGAGTALRGLPGLISKRIPWSARPPVAGSNMVPHGHVGYTAEALTYELVLLCICPTGWQRSKKVSIQNV